MGSSNLTSQGFSVNIMLESFLVASMVAVCSGSKMTIFFKFNCTSQKRPVSSRMVFPLPFLKVSKQLPFTESFDLRKLFFSYSYCLLEVCLAFLWS